LHCTSPLLISISGSYPGATAAKVQADFDDTEKAIVAAKKKLEETTQAFNAMRAARGLGDEENQVRLIRVILFLQPNSRDLLYCFI
jgi:hypothetical protein